jgi:Helicase HerA, central domain
MQNFEKLGAFFLGNRVDPASNVTQDELVLYDSKDLTTHAAIIGMTGSGKTGLGIGLIEEAAMDRVPVIAIDPKGDLANLLLTFPKFQASSFEPWVDGSAASEAGLSTSEYAAEQAALWKKGLAASGQSGERIRQLKSSCDFAVYTPGSASVAPLAVLGEFSAPGTAVLEDADVYNDLIEGTTTGLLSLLGLDAEPISSNEHILISNVLRSHWDKGESLDLAGLIQSLQQPSFNKIGVIDLDTFYPPKKRFALAMQINNLLAAPGFAAWLEGEPLDIDKLLYTDSGQPRVTVLSIAHLDDNQRMFFVTMLLNALLAWMRQQNGSSALRAMLYIDEIFGYMPPVANPPSKKPLLTLLKQARAFGLGLVLSTQNPVDLDYKGMSNMGTWFIGRLQTKRDQQRVLDGLRSSSGAGSIDHDSLPDLISNLAKRAFLLHNVHEKAPVLFSTRWVMSYLAGPLGRTQLKKLCEKQSSGKAKAQPLTNAKPSPRTRAKPATTPIIEPGIKQGWLEGGPDESGETVYVPEVAATVDVIYTSAKFKVDVTQRFTLSTELSDSDSNPSWSSAEEYLRGSINIAKKSPAKASFGECPGLLTQASRHKAWEKSVRTWIRTDRPLRLQKSAALKTTSNAGENERDFRIRLQQIGNERRDTRIGKLRGTYDKKVMRLEERLMKAEQTIERESEEATQSKVDAALSVGTALLGALLGRKRISTTTVSRAGTAARKAGRIRRQSSDVERARERAGAIEDELVTLKENFEDEVAALEDSYDAQSDELEEVLVRARSTNVQVRWFGILWHPT